MSTTVERITVAIAALEAGRILLVCDRCFGGRSPRGYEAATERWERIECPDCGGRLVTGARLLPELRTLRDYLERVTAP